MSLRPFKITEEAGRPNPWCVDLRRVGMGRRFFATKNEAETFEQRERDRILRDGTGSAAIMSHTEKVEYLSARDRLKGTSLSVVVDFWMKHKAAVEIPFRQAINQFISSRHGMNLRPKYLRELEYQLCRFCEMHEKKMVHEITKDDIAHWLSVNTWTSDTKTGVLNRLSAFFSYAEKQRWCAENHCKRIERPKQRRGRRPGILTPEEANRWMQTCLEHGPEFVKSEALKLFAGIRPAEVARLTESDLLKNAIQIDWEDVKAGDRRLVKINPTLRAWLKAGTTLHPPVNRRNAENRRNKLRALANQDENGNPLPPIKWSHDCMRHSFVSYMVPIHGVIETSNQAGNSEKICRTRYLQIVTKKEAKAFWAIRPE